MLEYLKYIKAKIENIYLKCVRHFQIKKIAKLKAEIKLKKDYINKQEVLRTYKK